MVYVLICKIKKKIENYVYSSYNNRYVFFSNSNKINLDCKIELMAE